MATYDQVLMVFPLGYVFQSRQIQTTLQFDSVLRQVTFELKMSVKLGS